FYRRLAEGVHPEIEMGRYLTEAVAYRNAPRVLGVIEYRPETGRPVPLGVVHDFVRNQGDGWSWTREYLDRHLEEAEVISSEAISAAPDPHAAYATFVATLGKRVAELHQALARPTSDPAFRPESLGARDLAHWR